MRRQNKIKIQTRFRRKFFWLFAAAAVCALLFDEQIAALYVLATLAMSGLLIVVAFSNLEARDAEMHAAIGKGADDISANSKDLIREKEQPRNARPARAKREELNRNS